VVPIRTTARIDPFEAAMVVQAEVLRPAPKTTPLDD
jgi:hypothetical protein